MTITQLKVRDELPKGKVGQVWGSSQQFVEDDAAHPAGALEQISTLTITAQNDTEYTYDVEGETISFTSDGTATKAEIAAGLKAAHEANIIARGVAEPTIDGSDNLVLTSGRKRASFDVSTDDANLTLAATQDASEEDDVPVGRAVWYSGADKVNLTAQGDLKDLKFTVDTVANDTDYEIGLSIDGRFHRALITSDGTATEDEILTDLQTELDALGLDEITTSLDTSANPSELHVVAANVGANDLEVADLSDSLSVAVDTEGTDFEAVFAGVSRHTYDVESDEPYSTDNGPYGARERVQFLRRGHILVDAPNASRGDIAYIGTASDEEGQIFDSQNTAGDRIKAPLSAMKFVDSYILEITVGY